MHMGTLIIWVILRMFETVDGHSGYEFSWSPFRLLPLSGILYKILIFNFNFKGSANYHSYHHTHNIGNYGSFFTIWDTIMKTN